jgi:hypothetical protein
MKPSSHETHVPAAQKYSPSTSDVSSAFKSASEMSGNALRGTVDYARRHPIRIMIGLGALSFAIAKLFRSKRSPIADELH